jgi:hypothetical protein
MTDETSMVEASGRRAVWIAILVVGAIVIPRSIAISQAHTESCDDQYHRTRGLAFLARNLGVADIAPRTLVNDPPLGEGIIALPLWVSNLACGRRPSDPGLYDHPLGPDFVLGLIAAWKALLFLPMVGVVFAWCRANYGPRSAWLAAGLLAVEPNLAAHLPIPALDVLGAEAIVIASWLGWRSFQRPTPGRQAAAGLGLAAALAIKHTGLIIPPILAAFAFLWWGVKPLLDGRSLRAAPGRLVAHLGAVGRTLAVAVVALWALLLFDVSPKSFKDLWASSPHPVAASSSSTTTEVIPLKDVSRWPGGSYIRAVKEGLKHNGRGHPAYLLGEKRELGWWYYFPVVSTIKVPVGVWVLLLLSVASVGRNRPRWPEWGMLVPALACLALAISMKVNIGFRHFLPTYLFLLMLSTRSVAGIAPRLTYLGWIAAGAVAVHPAGFHPDYLSYTNGLWRNPHLAISDSNVDWGQGLKEVRAWVDARPPDGRPIRLGYFGNLAAFPYYLGDRPVECRNENDPIPNEGILIVSPVFVAGPYDPRGNYAALQGVEPDEVIGHSLLVFDLDRLNRREGRREKVRDREK